MNSERFAAGTSLCTTSTFVVLASSASGVKPLRVSYGSLPRKAGLITWSGDEISKANAMGAAGCTCSVPICPLAPARLSTTTDCPSACCKSLAMRRATTSVMPPGGKGTTRVMGRLGHGAASAASAGALPRHATMAAAPSCAKWRLHCHMVAACCCPAKRPPDRHSSGPDAKRLLAGLAQARGQMDKVDQARARLARVDDVFDDEGFGAAEWRRQAAQPLLDLGALATGVLGRFDLGLVGDIQAAFYRQRAPVGRGPCVAPIVPPHMLVAGGGHAVGTAHDDRAPWHRRLINRGQRAHARAHHAGFLGIDPDLKARDIDQVDHRQMKYLRQVDEADQLV